MQKVQAGLVSALNLLTREFSRSVLLLSLNRNTFNLLLRPTVSQHEKMSIALFFYSSAGRISVNRPAVGLILCKLSYRVKICPHNYFSKFFWPLYFVVQKCSQNDSICTVFRPFFSTSYEAFSWVYCIGLMLRPSLVLIPILESIFSLPPSRSIHLTLLILTKNLFSIWSEKKHYRTYSAYFVHGQRDGYSILAIEWSFASWRKFVVKSFEAINYAQQQGPTKPFICVD